MGSDEVIALLDTHAAIWLITADRQLGRRSRALVAEAARKGAVAISAISFWELALLIERGRLTTPLSAVEVRGILLGMGVEEVPVTGDVALLSTQIGLHGDPADRFIAASAVTHDATLVTADARLLKWKHPLKRQNALR